MKIWALFGNQQIETLYFIPLQGLYPGVGWVSLFSLQTCWAFCKLRRKTSDIHFPAIPTDNGVEAICPRAGPTHSTH